MYSSSTKGVVSERCPGEPTNLTLLVGLSLQEWRWWGFYCSAMSCYVLVRLLHVCVPTDQCVVFVCGCTCLLNTEVLTQHHVVVTNTKPAFWPLFDHNTVTSLQASFLFFNMEGSSLSLADTTSLVQ